MQNKTIRNYFRTVLALGVTSTAPLVNAVELSFQPRFETGLAYYDLVQEKLNSPVTFAGRPLISIGEVSTSDILPFVGGGGALFINRFYVDFSAQHYFSGSDDSPVTSTNINRAGTLAPLIQTDTVTTNLGRQKDDFQRTDWAVAIGYSINDHWSVYTGYKQAVTTIDSVLTGQVQTAPVTAPSAADPRVSGTYRSDARRAFDYDGPFVGTSVTWDVNQGWLNGALSGNIAVAFLDGQAELTTSNFILSNQIGLQIPIDTSVPAAPTLGTSTQGSAVGVSLGVNWKGYTSVENLTYAVGVSGYRYDFSSDSRSSQDLQETLVRGNLNVAYAFDL